MIGAPEYDDGLLHRQGFYRDPRNRDEKQIEELRKLLNSHKEVRITDPQTGGEKGQKDARFDLIPNEFEWALAKHFGVGAKKYAERNWEKGYRWSLTVGALRRHLSQFLAGEDYDAETGSHHMIAVAWHAMALFIFSIRRIGTDDMRRLEGAATQTSA